MEARVILDTVNEDEPEFVQFLEENGIDIVARDLGPNLMGIEYVCPAGEALEEMIARFWMDTYLLDLIEYS